MFNPPFGSPLPLHGEEEDFSFPIEAPNDPINTIPNPLDIQEISPISLPSSSLPMTDYEDLSMFLDYEEDFDPLIGQFPTIQGIPNEWVREIEQGDDHDLEDPVQQGAQQGSSDGQGSDQHRPIDHHDHHQGGEGSSMKKLDHNAKERVRRLKLNASYLAFRSLLPESKKAKEKWSAPYIIDRALDYIPQLQAEIDKLTLEKTNMLSVIGKQPQQQGFTVDDNQAVPNDKHTLTVSINEVKRGEVIIQICQQKGKLDREFSTLIEKLEEEEILVLSASSLHVSEDRSCFHLHVQIRENQIGDDYSADLHKKLICWLS